jgi:hypothetical protein
VNFFYIVGGAIIPLLLSLTVLALVRPRSFWTAVCVVTAVGSGLGLLQIRSGTETYDIVAAEFAVSCVLATVVYYIAKILIVSVVKQGEIVVQKRGVQSRASSKWEKIIALFCLALVLLFSGVIVATYLNRIESRPAEAPQVQPLFAKSASENGLASRTKSCYILINKGLVVKVADELDGYVTSQYDKSGSVVWVYFEKGTTEKQVREYWNSRKTQILNTCGFLAE